MAQGSNELNMLLKAKVVKLKVELDYKNSGLKGQVDKISNFLKDNPVKLKVELQKTGLVQEINKLNKYLAQQGKNLQLGVEFKYNKRSISSQIREINNILKRDNNTPTIKVGVEIDVRGSATAIKKQLHEVNKTVEEFNKKYGSQLEKVKNMTEKTKDQLVKNVTSNNIPMDAGVKNFNNIKQYVNQLKEAERILKSKTPDGKGLFSSIETKDAQGNLTGFIASLEKADGVVDRVRYKWDKDKNAFMVIDRTTLTQTEKNVHQAMQTLKSLEGQINKTGDQAEEFRKQYDKLMNDGANGKLTKDAVRDLQNALKLQTEMVEAKKKENAQLLAQEKLINKIERARDKNWKKTFNLDDRTQYNNLINSVSNDPENLEKYRFELQKITDAEKEANKVKKESLTLDQKKAKALAQLNKYATTISPVNTTAHNLIAEAKAMINYTKNADDFIKVQKKMADIADEASMIKVARTASDYGQKIDKVLRQIVKTGNMSIEDYRKTMDELPKIVNGNLGEAERLYRQYNERLQKILSESFFERGKKLENPEGLDIKNLIENKETEALKDYISKQYNGMRVATIGYKEVADATNGTIKKLNVAFESKGKVLRTVQLELDNTTKGLREMANAESYNPNRNLGVFEQLKIAMERVPVWMVAMTAFYGTLRSVQAMTTEILKLDQALTELRRVASDSLNIDSVFEGSVSLSKELGNNIHDVMQSVNDLARTFGEFNERQLLAITRTATLMSNVSDLSAQESANTLVGTMNAFNITAEESIRIVDAMNEVNLNQPPLTVM